MENQFAHPTTPDGKIILESPAGQLESVDPSEAAQSIAEGGYKPADPAKVQAIKLKASYETPGQKALTAIEGALTPITLGTIPKLEEMSGLTTGKDYLNRAAINPKTHLAGEVAPFLVPLLGEAAGALGVGSGVAEGASAIGGAGGLGLIGSAEAAAPRLLGLTGETIASKIGSSAARNAVGAAAFSGTDEIAKMMADPQHAAEGVGSAISNVGLNALFGAGLGAGLGSVSPIWKATVGSKVSKVLQAVRDRLGGIEGSTPDVIKDALQKTGIDLSPEMRAAVSSDPYAQQAFQHLQESTSQSGIKAQESLKDFRRQIDQSSLASLGRTSEQIPSDFSEYEAGKKIQTVLADELKQKVDPVSKQFEAIKNKFKDTELPQSIKDGITDQIGKLAEQEGYQLSPSSSQMREINRVMTDLPNLKSLNDLSQYQSRIGDNTNAPDLWRVGGQLKRALRGAEQDLISAKLGETEGPEVIRAHAEARATYTDLMSKIDDLNSRLHVGKFGGPESFMKAFREMSPEDVARRMSGKGDVDLLNLVSKDFPRTAAGIKDYHLDQILGKSAAKATEGSEINAKALFSSLDKLSPELKSFLLSPEALTKLEANKALLDGVPSKMNSSGTAKTIDSLWKKIPGTAMGMITFLKTHNPVLSVLMAPLTEWAGRDAPDAVKLGMLKFLGSAQSVDSEGFKSMIDFASHMAKGENLLNKTTKNLIQGESDVLPQALHPDQKTLEKLDRRLKEFRDDARPLLDMGGMLGHYMPDHAVHLSQTGANAVQYLNNQRPNPVKRAPLDAEAKPSTMEESAYQRTLKIAEQPLVVLDHIKKGTLVPSDVQTVKSLYGPLYSRINQKLMDQIMEASSKGVQIPYQTRLGLSLFMGEPLDSTMTAEGISAHQNMFVPPPSKMANPKGSMTSLSKMPGLSMTAGQLSEGRKSLK